MAQKSLIYIYDIEVYPNFFCVTFAFKDEVYTYEVSERKNELGQMKTFLKGVKGLIGFNSLHYDQKILSFVMDSDLPHVQDINKAIYDFNEEVIENKHPMVKNRIRQLDLFKLWHFNNKARRTSLKGLEIAMQSKDVRDLPYPPGTYLDESVLDEVISYNIHDVRETEKFYNHFETQEMLKLRKDLGKKYGIKLSNHSNSAIGETVMLKEYCRVTGKAESYIKHLRGQYRNYRMEHIIDERIKFESPRLQSLLEDLRRKNIGNFEEIKFLLDELPLKVAKGGLHSDNDPFYLKEGDFILKDLDAGSYYPHLMLTFNIFPRHLGPEFLDVLREIVTRRLKAKKKKGDPEAALEAASLKITVNSIYGKLNDEYSFLYDPFCLYRVTINGQLMLIMLAEKLQSVGKIIYANTDGLTYKLKPENEKELERITDEFFASFDIPVEYDRFKMMALRDCNNFIFETTSGKIKKKGKMFVTEREFHKDHSMVIVSKAIENYFIKGIPVETTVKESDNIFDFCMATKFGRNSKGHLVTVNSDEPVGKNFRYIVANKGPVLLKKYDDGRKEFVWRGYNVEPFNYAHEFKDINYKFYTREANKIIDQIVNQTGSLF